MSDTHKAYCGRCKTWHYFGFDECGAPTQLMACYETKPPRSDASRTLLHGSAGSGSHELRSRTNRPAGNRTHLLPLAIITALLALSSPAYAQEPAGGPVIDRIEARIEQVREVQP